MALFWQFKRILISSSRFLTLKMISFLQLFVRAISNLLHCITSRLMLTLSPLAGSSSELHGDTAPRACRTGGDQTHHQQAARGTRQLTQRRGNPETRAQWIQSRACCVNIVILAHKNNHYKCTNQHFQFACCLINTRTWVIRMIITRGIMSNIVKFMF